MESGGFLVRKRFFMQNVQNINDLILLHKLKEGDNSAFQELYNKYYSILYLHVYQKLKDREVAKDIVHDLFISIWQKRSELSIKGQVSSYMYAAIRNRVIDYISKEKSKLKYLETLTEPSQQESSEPDYLLREKQLAEQIESVLDRLSPRVKEVFDLSRKEYLSHKEIANKLNISEHSVRGYIKLALRLLKMKFGSILYLMLIFFCKYL